MKSRFALRIPTFLLVLNSLMSFAPAYAEEVSLDRDHVTLQTDRATLVRNHRTPKKIKIDIPVAISNIVCGEYGTQIVIGPHSSCGTEPYIERVAVNRCVKLAKCKIGPNNEKKCECVQTARVYEEVVRHRNRSCRHPETVCVRHDVVTHRESKRVTLQFKNVQKLSANDEELFELTGRQLSTDGLDIDFHLQVLKADVRYKIDSKERSLFTDKIVVTR